MKSLELGGNLLGREKPEMLPEGPEGQLEASAKLASKKLERLMSGGFDGYVTRYMNIDEYRQLLREKNFHGEVVVRTGEPFNKFIDLSGIDSEFWGRTVGQVSEAHWSTSSGAMNKYSRLLHKLRRIHNQQAGEKGGRQKIMKEFRAWLLEDDFAIDLSVGNRYGKLLEEDPGSEELKGLIDHNGKTRLEIFRDFLNNENFLDSPDNLRSLFLAIADVPHQLPRRFEGEEEEDYQISLDLVESLNFTDYHIMVIYDADQLQLAESQERYDHWREIRGTKEASGKEILGVIAMLPDKTLVQELVDRSSHSGKMAHPVFSDRGIVRYPKQ